MVHTLQQGSLAINKTHIINPQRACTVRVTVHVHLRAMHTLSYGDKGHLYECMCMRRGWAYTWL